MSGAALRKAVETRLRSELGLRDGECKVMDDGKPMPSAGILFVAVHPGGWRPQQPADYYLDEVLGVDITISLKAGHHHIDRWGEKIIGVGPDSFEFIARKIIAFVHKDYPLLQIANGLIVGDSAKFVEPLSFAGGDSRTTERGSEWWGSKSRSDVSAGRSMELSFDGARRVQEKAELDPDWE